SGGKRLCVIDVHLRGVEMQLGDAEDLQVGKRRGLMLHSAYRGNRRVIRLHRSSCAEGGLHQTGGACACSSRASGCAAGSRARGASSEAAYTPARRASHDSCIDAAEGSASLGSLNIGVGDGQVISGNGQIEIIFQRQGDCVLQRDIQLAIADEAVDAWRVLQLRLGYLTWSVRAEW